MQVLHDTFANDDSVAVLAVHFNDKGDPAAYLAKHEYTFPSVTNGQDVCRRFGIKAIPTFIVVDGDGEVIHKHVGRLTDNARDEIERIARAQSG